MWLTQMPVRGPSLSDGRLHVALTVTTLHLVGQVSLGFSVSVPQILVCLLVCAAVEITVTVRRERMLAWPASGLLTGNGIAFLLRSSGTGHGHWWATTDLWVFAATAALAMGTRYLLRVDGRPLFNPSNVAVVAVLLTLGADRVHPLDLWWGPPSPATLLCYAVLAFGGTAVVVRLGLAGVAVAFWMTLAVLWAAVVAGGHDVTARWAVGPLTGWDLWSLVVASPEVLLLAFFMVTEPQALPARPAARRAFGCLAGALAAGLMATRTTEYGLKVALLSGLTVAYLTRPALDRAGAASPGRTGRRSGPAVRAGHVLRTATGAAAAVTAVAAFALPAGRPTDSPDVVVRAVGPLPVHLPASAAGTVLEDLTWSVTTAGTRWQAGDVRGAADATTGVLRLQLLDGGTAVARSLALPAGGRPAVLVVERTATATQAPPRLRVRLGDTEYLVQEDGGRYRAAAVRQPAVGP